MDTKGNVPLFIPNNYEELLANREMTNLLSNVNGLRLYSIAFYELALEKIRQILLEIKDEIRRLE